MFDCVDFISTAQATSFIWSSNIVEAMDELIYEGFPPSEIMSARWFYVSPFEDGDSSCLWEYSFHIHDS